MEEGFTKICRVKKRVGDGGEHERTLDDMSGTKVTLRSCCESDLRKNFAKVAKILRLLQKYWKTNLAKL